MAVPAGRPDAHNPVVGILWMVAASLCFSASLTLVKALQDEGVSVFQTVLFRQIFGLMIFTPLLVRGWPAIVKSDVRPRHFIRAATGFIGMSCTYYSFSLINLADSVALQFTLPFFTMLAAVWLLGEKIRRHRVIATAIGFIGVLVIVRPGFAEINHGIFFALAGTAFYAISDTNARYLARHDRLPAIMLYNFIFMLPLAAIPSAIWWVTPSPDTWPQILAFVIAGVGAQFCLTKSFGAAEAGLVSPILFLRLPLVAAIGYIFFAQTTQLLTWVGAGVICAATLWMTREETRRQDGPADVRT
ncbi:MAG: DMT family transporter [Rhodospirillaceae bacterium]